MNKTFVYCLLLPLLFQECKKDYRGIKSSDIAGTWYLRAILNDKNNNGFDSADIIQTIPVTANFYLVLNLNGKSEYWNKSDNFLNGYWFLTEKPNHRDTIQWLLLNPNMYGTEIDAQIVYKSNSKMILYYYELKGFDANDQPIYEHKGFIYEKN